MKGKSIIFSAPSGSGKTTIVKHLLKQNLNLEFSISACSREPRANEVHGMDYYFLSVQDFRNRIEQGDFLEWEEVYKDHYYGTLKTELNRIWDEGRHVLFDVDVVGGSNLKKILGDDALAIFVKPPSLEILEQRLRDRSSDPEEKIKDRLAKASEEMEHANRFDAIILNDRLDDAFTKAEELVTKFLSN